MTAHIPSCYYVLGDTKAPKKKKKGGEGPPANRRAAENNGAIVRRQHMCRRDDDPESALRAKLRIIEWIPEDDPLDSDPVEQGVSNDHSSHPGEPPAPDTIP